MRSQNPEISSIFGRHGGHHTGERGAASGGRRRRLFDADALRLMALQLIADEPRHGYDVIRALAERSGGAWSPSPGMVYPLLTMLTEMELIREDATDGSRKRFAISETGAAELAGGKEDVKRLFERLDSLAGEAARVDPAPVRRAMHNLRSALVERLRRDGATDETVFAAVALIDGAAQAIERL
jgi:DNA-binding PadR family transcriptional regulator